MKDKEKLVCLVEALKKGDEDSFSEIYNLTNKDIFYGIVKIIRNEEAAYDLMQETYIQIYNKISTLEDSRAFLGWAKKIASNKTSRYIYKYRKELLVDESNEYIFENTFEEREEFIPHEILESEEKKRLIREIIEALPELQRITVYKYYFYMLSISEIAEEMECSEGTVKSRLNYARKKIEEGVLDLEKKGTKLYGFGALPVLFMLLREEAKAQTLSSKKTIDTFNNISDAVNIKSINNESNINGENNTNSESSINNENNNNNYNDIDNENNVNKDSNINNEGNIGSEKLSGNYAKKALMSSRMVKGGLALLTAAAIGAGAIAVSNMKDDNNEIAIEESYTSNINDDLENLQESNSNSEEVIFEDENLESSSLISLVIDRAKKLEEFIVTGNYESLENYQETINSIGIDEEGVHGWTEMNWISSIVGDLESDMEYISDKIEKLNSISDLNEDELKDIENIKVMINVFLDNQNFISDLEKNLGEVSNYSTTEESLQIKVDLAKEFLNDVLPSYKEKLNRLKSLTL